METKNKFSLLKDEVADTTVDEARSPQENRSEVVWLLTERWKATRINKENKGNIDNRKEH